MNHVGSGSLSGNLFAARGVVISLLLLDPVYFSPGTIRSNLVQIREVVCRVSCDGFPDIEERSHGTAD
jgi:hypothetical protein